MLVATRHDVPVPAEPPVYREDVLASVAVSDVPHAASFPNLFTTTITGLDLPALHGVAHRPLPDAVHAPPDHWRDRQERRAALALRPARQRRVQRPRDLRSAGVRRQRAPRPGTPCRAASTATSRWTGRSARTRTSTRSPTRARRRRRWRRRRSPRRARSGCRPGRPTGSSSASSAIPAASASSASSTARPASRPCSTPPSRSARRRRRPRRAGSRTSTAASRSRRRRRARRPLLCDAACRLALASGNILQPVTLTPRSPSDDEDRHLRRARHREAQAARPQRAAPARGRQVAARHREARAPTASAGTGRSTASASSAGTYLLTYRSLKGTRITNTSGSIRFKIAKGGKVRQVRAEPLRTPKR